MSEVVELLSKLISIPSVNPMGRPLSGPQFLETKMTAYLEEWLRPLGLELSRQTVHPGRDNLLAMYRSPGAKTHMLMEVHQDTVPVDGMTIAPFEPKVEGNRLYGRGACDDKGPMAAMLLALKRLALEKPKGAANVTLALTADEEYGAKGVLELVRRGLDVDCAVVAEPSELDLIVAHKGAVRWEIVTSGRACHSSAPEHGVNAVYRMAPVLLSLERFAAELTKRPPYPLCGGPTLSVGVISGGVSVNTVPDFCRIEIDRRTNPDEDPKQAYEDVRRHLQADSAVGAGWEFRPPSISSPGLPANKNIALAEAFGRSIDTVRGSHQKLGVPFGTDASKIAAVGIPSIVFGPGSISKAHTDDEWVPIDEIEIAAEVYYHFCTNAGDGVTR